MLLKQGWISSLSYYLASHSREGASMASLQEVPQSVPGGRAAVAWWVGPLPFMGLSQALLFLGLLAFSCSFLHCSSLSSKNSILYC